MNAATDFLPASGLLAQLDLLRIEHAGAVTHLCLNRPAKRNAINEELMRQLHTAPERVTRGFAFAQLSGLVVQRVAQLRIRDQLRHDADPGFGHDRLDLVERVAHVAVPELALQ